MKKEKALGSIPTFETKERKTEELDLFKTDKKTDTKKNEKEQLKAQIQEEIEKGKEAFKKSKKEKTLEELEEELKASEKHITKIQENLDNETNTKDNVASTQRAVRKGYIRQTFVISKENLELIRALTSFLQTKQVDLLEALINKGLEVFSEEEKEQALELYRNTTTENDNTLSKYFK